VTEAGSFEHRRRIVRPDGEIRVVLGRGFLERDDDGNRVRIVGFEQDVTELAAAEAELRRKEELLERTAELGRVGGWEHDLDTGEIRWSRQLLEMHGLADDFVPTNESWSALVHPDDLEASRAAVIAAVDECRTWEFRRRVIRPDGAIRVMLG